MDERKRINLSIDDLAFTFWRLSDAEYSNLHEYCLKIIVNDDHKLMMDLVFSARDGSLNLAGFFVVLQQWFGESSKSFDNWKGTFSFPVLMQIVKPKRSYFYVVNFFDHRGTFRFDLFRLTKAIVKGKDANIPHQPFTSEFSQQEINSFQRGLYQQIKEAFAVFSKLPATPFLKKVDSNLVLYGYKDGAYFEQDCDSGKDYRMAIKSFYHGLPTMSDQENLRGMVAMITGLPITLPR